MVLVTSVTGTHIEGNGSISFPTVALLAGDVVLAVVGNGPEHDGWPDGDYPIGTWHLVDRENASDLGFLAAWREVTADGSVAESLGPFLGSTNMVGILMVWRGPGMLPFDQITINDLFAPSSTETATVADQQVQYPIQSKYPGSILITVALVAVDNTVLGSFSEQGIAGGDVTLINQHGVARTGAVLHIAAAYRESTVDDDYPNMSATYTEPTTALRLIGIAINPNPADDDDSLVDLAPVATSSTPGGFVGVSAGEAPRDILIDRTTGDFVITRDLHMVSGKEAVAQAVWLRLQRLVGEWFLAPAKGMPWLEDFANKNPNLVAIRERIRQEIDETVGVAAVLEVSIELDRQTRTLTGTWSATTDTGEFIDGTIGSAT